MQAVTLSEWVEDPLSWREIFRVKTEPRFALRGATALLIVSLSALGAAAQPLPSDHVIVPGTRIGNAELEPADQGALQRNLGEPNQTDQRGDMATYRYGAPKADGGRPDELVVILNLNTDAPFEIATASPDYHIKGGLGVGSSDAAVRTALGPPLCTGDDGKGNGIIVYETIWFRTVQGKVTRAAIRNHMSADEFKTGEVHC